MVQPLSNKLINKDKKQFAVIRALAFRNEMRLAGMSFQETLTSLLNIVLLSTGNKATKAVIPF
jgi:hypothetical protein